MYHVHMRRSSPLKSRGEKMSFNYQKYMNSIRTFHISMRNLNVRIGTFEFTYNGVMSDVILDTRVPPWNLIFIKRNGHDTLTLFVEGYCFIISGDRKYQEFIEYFNISGDKGAFSIADFSNSFSNTVPVNYVLNNKKREKIIRYDIIDNKSEGIYPIGLKNWELIHASNPELPSDKYHRSPENLMKTRELYPKIYAVIRDMDITVMYGKVPNENTSSLEEGIIPQI